MKISIFLKINISFFLGKKRRSDCLSAFREEVLQLKREKNKIQKERNKHFEENNKIKMKMLHMLTKITGKEN